MYIYISISIYMNDCPKLLDKPMIEGEVLSPSGLGVQKLHHFVSIGSVNNSIS